MKNLKVEPPDIQQLQIIQLKLCELDVYNLNVLFKLIREHLEKLYPGCTCELILGSWYIHPELEHCYFSIHRIPCNIHERCAIKSLLIVRIHVNTQEQSEYHLISDSYNDLNAVFSLITRDNENYQKIKGQCKIISGRPAEIQRRPTYLLHVIFEERNVA